MRIRMLAGLAVAAALAGPAAAGEVPVLPPSFPISHPIYQPDWPRDVDYVHDGGGVVSEGTGGGGGGTAAAPARRGSATLMASAADRAALIARIEAELDRRAGQ